MSPEVIYYTVQVVCPKSSVTQTERLKEAAQLIPTATWGIHYDQLAEDRKPPLGLQMGLIDVRMKAENGSSTTQERSWKVTGSENQHPQNTQSFRCKRGRLLCVDGGRDVHRALGQAFSTFTGAWKVTGCKTVDKEVWCRHGDEHTGMDTKCEHLCTT